jgi:hypothetical protein
VSAAIAELAQQWHVYNDADTRSVRRALQTPDLEENKILDIYFRTAAEQLIIEHLLSEHDHVTISYDEIANTIDEVLARIRIELGGVELDTPGNEFQLPKVTRGNVASYSEVESCLSNVLRKKRAEIRAQTLEKLLIMTGLSGHRAEVIFQEGLDQVDHCWGTHS